MNLIKQLLLSLLVFLMGHSLSHASYVYPESEITCALFNKGNFVNDPFQEIRFFAKGAGDTGTAKAESILGWDADNRSYPFRYMRFRSAGYLIRGQRLIYPFSQGDVFLRLAIYRSIATTDGGHELLKAIDLKTPSDPTSLTVKDPAYGATIKCDIKNI
jgi:hypothetical protein